MLLLNNSADVLNNSIILCSDEKVLKVLCYRDVIRISETIKDVLSKNIIDKNPCLGLLMNHNIYLPSIILSIQTLKYSFVYLTARNIDKILSNLKCLWILSLDDVERIPSFQEVNRLKLGDNTLILWNRHDSFSRDLNLYSESQNIFCVVQTSGSTGEDKLIRVTNTCIHINARNLRNVFDIKPEDVIFWGTNLTFDPSLIELILGLQSGACLVIVPYNISVNPRLLYKALFNVANVTFLQMVPSLFLRWDEQQIKQILLNPQLKILALGGECFPKKILSYQRGSNLRIFNLYGISEVSCWATLHNITDESINDDIPIGGSLEETIVELRDECGRKINKGKGEIFIGGSSRVCYINKESPTELSGTIFRETGDIAEANEKGIFLIGRKNKIIKRFGHKINLTKLENKIFEETGLENKCLWSQEHAKIITFILMKDLDIELKRKILDKLHIKLINILPEDSFPDFIDIVTKFPLTSHGKINEKALANLYVYSKTAMTCKDAFRLLWCKYVGISCDHMFELKHLKFFESGGNSISALQLLTEYKEMINYDYPKELVTMIFENSYIEIVNYLVSFKQLRNKQIENTEIVEGYCLKRRKVDKDDLKIVWSYNLKACVDSTPLIFKNGEMMYISIGSFSHKFLIFYENGQVFYEITLPDSIESTSSISQCQNFVLVGCFNGTMYCIDFMEKQIAWEFETGDKIKSSACFCRQQSAAVFGSYDKMIYCLSVKEGLELWNVSLDGSISSNPVYDEEKKCIYTATLRGTCYRLNEDGQIVWKNNCTGPIFGTPCLVDNGNIIFPVVQGILYCLQTENGEMLWNYQTTGHIFSSLVFYKNRILFGCHDKTVNVLEVSPSCCTLVKKIMVGSETSTTPFVGHIQGICVLVTACNSGLISVIDFESFELLSNIQLPGEVFSSPVIHNNKIYVGCRDNNFYCIEMNKQLNCRHYGSVYLLVHLLKNLSLSNFI